MYILLYIFSFPVRQQRWRGFEDQFSAIYFGFRNNISQNILKRYLNILKNVSLTREIRFNSENFLR
jgi:hypothetical protein